MKYFKKIMLIILTILCFIAVAIGLYSSDYYHATDQSIDALKTSETVTVSSTKNMKIFEPTQSSDIGLIFYPGAKVEYTAYAPLLKAIASQGINCYLVHMPLNLAILDSNKANAVISKYPNINTWYIAGHSLGGAMASKYAAENSKKLKGIIFLGAYAYGDLKNTSLKMLSLYGTQDKVVNRTKLESSKSNNPLDTTYLEIKGANHAYFGSYGEQKGDGTAAITPEKQWEITASEILKFIQD